MEKRQSGIMHRIILTILFVMIAALAGSAYCAEKTYAASSGSFEAYDGSFVQWNWNDDYNLLEVSSNGTTGSFSLSNIAPWCKYLNSAEKVVVKDGVKGIGADSFRSYSSNNAIRKIELPDSLTSISQHAFDDVYQMRYLFIPKNVRTIENYVFPGYNGDSKSKLRYIIFRGHSIDFDPWDVKDPIGQGYDTYRLYYPKNDTTWDLTSVPTGTNLPYTDAGYCGEDLAWILEPDGHLIITGDGAMPSYEAGGTPWYQYQESITSITVEEGVTGLGSRAFDCPFATKISLPSTLTDLEFNAFYNCYTVEEVELAEGNETFTLCDGALYTKDMKKLVFCPMKIGTEDFVIAEGTKEIGDCAFTDCYWLKSISIPDSVEKIGVCAFGACSHLTSMKIPEGVTEIPSECFSCCRRLEEVYLPAGITKIGDSAFYSCPYIKTFAVPESVTRIDELAFAGCIGLTDFYFADQCPELEDSIFRGVTANVYYDADDEIGGAYYYRRPYDGDMTWIPKTDLAKESEGLAFAKTMFMYNGKPHKLSVLYNGESVKNAALDGSGGTVSTDPGSMLCASYSNTVNAGKASVKVSGNRTFKGSVTRSYTIAKAVNSMKVKGKTATVRYKKLKKAAQSLARTKVISFTKAGQGAKTYTLAGVTKSKFKKYFKVNASTGKLTIKKGLKKGTYKVKIKVKAAGNSNYQALTKTVTVTVKVK